MLKRDIDYDSGSCVADNKKRNKKHNVSVDCRHINIQLTPNELRTKSTGRAECKGCKWGLVPP